MPNLIAACHPPHLVLSTHGVVHSTHYDTTHSATIHHTTTYYGTTYYGHRLLNRTRWSFLSAAAGALVFLVSVSATVTSVMVSHAIRCRAMVSATIIIREMATVAIISKASAMVRHAVVSSPV